MASLCSRNSSNKSLGKFLAFHTILIFSIFAHGQTFTVLHTFNESDGAEPQSGLVRDPSGNLYGSTEYGGKAGAGVVFRLNGRSEATVYNFQDVPDGARPFAALISDGYGTTYTGGDNCTSSYSCGTVFKLSPSGETVLYRFKGAPDGANPHSGLVRDAKGNLYGSTITGGDGNCDFPFG